MTSSSKTLPWPFESTCDLTTNALRWSHPRSNICLDFHGDPITARLTVLSDGNHHMALQEALQAFNDSQPACNSIFYVSTPPYMLLHYIRSGSLHLGNLTLSPLPNVFISPANIMNILLQEGLSCTPINGHGFSL